MSTPTHVITQNFSVTKAERSDLLGHRSGVFWLTGLSGSGKSTLADLTSAKLHARRIGHYILDGDNTRGGLCNDLGFTLEDRRENVRRVAEVARLMSDAGLVVLVSLISPMQEDRNLAREIIGESGFFEVFVHCPIEMCVKRDPKGLYQKALAGEILQFTGIHSPYETPANPDLILDTSTTAEDELSAKLITFILHRIQ